MAIVIVHSKDHDIDIYLISRYIAQIVVLLSPSIMGKPLREKPFDSLTDNF